MNLVGGVVLCVVTPAYCEHESLHVGFGHCDGCGLNAFLESVLECGDVVDFRVEFVSLGTNEEKVGDYGDLSFLRLPFYLFQDPV